MIIPTPLASTTNTNNPNAPPNAIVVHRCPRRLRLRVDLRRHQVGFFSDLVTSLAHCNGVARVTANPTAASVAIIMQDDDPTSVLAYAAQHGLFNVTCMDPPIKSVLFDTTTRLREADSTLRRLSHGTLDMGSFVYIVLIGLAAIQALRGNIVGPSSTLLWNALSLAQIGDLAKRATKI